MRSFHLFYAGLISSASLFFADAYDIRCLYPNQTPEPWDIREYIGNYISEFHNPAIIDEDAELALPPSETPMVIRDGYYWSGCQTMCLHYHDPRVSDPFTKQTLPTRWSVPDFAQNAHSISMCFAQCYAHMSESWGSVALNDYLRFAHTELHLDITSPLDETAIKEATHALYNTGNSEDLKELIRSERYLPFLMGHIAGFRVMLIADNDGWNANGALQYSRGSDSPVPCTGSCRAYQDTYGYKPKPDPRTWPDLYSGLSKYDCEGICRNWQPLQEGNIKGSIKRQEFVVPHIGGARTFLRDVATEHLPDPMYNLKEEADLVIEELRQTSSSDYKKRMINFMDEKLKLRSLIRVNMRNDPYFSSAIPFNDYILFVYGMTVAEYDGVVQAWNEKVYHDIVRPTTYIKHWDTDMLETFGGDMDHDGPVMIKARDFEAARRVMPHAEYPSGSSCLCTAYMEFVDAYTQYYHNRKLENIVTPASEGRDMFADMTEVRDTCNQSRLWAGLHFRASIDAGQSICEGLGELALQYVDEMKNTDITYQGVDFNRGDDLENCPP